jgi:hypothetical protein
MADGLRSTKAIVPAILVGAVLAGCGGQASTRSGTATTTHATVVLTQRDDGTALRALAQIQAAGKLCREHEGQHKWLTAIISKRLEAAEAAHVLAQLVHTNGSRAVVSISGAEATLGEYVDRADLALEGCPTMEAIVDGLRQASAGA